MNEKIALLLNDAMSRLRALSKKQLIIAGSGVAAAAIIIAATVLVSGSGSDIKTDRNKAIAQEKAYAIAINGEEILYVPTEDDAKAVIGGIAKAYVSENASIEEYGFEEEITYTTKHIVTAAAAAKSKAKAQTYICDVDEAVKYILNGTSTPLTYTVQGGDTLWDIAVKNNVSVYELEQMNPGKFEKLSIGETLNLYQKTPLVNVVTTEVVTTAEVIPYSTNYTNSDTLYKGQTKVQNAGVNGSKEAVAKISKRNGIETSRVLVSEKVIAEPVMQTALKGTKAIPVTVGSGALQNPVAHMEISSAYGASRGGGRSHKGIDLRASKGTAFVASDAGTVTFAGWKGSYGNLIIVNHGNGIQTKYAHCNSISVSSGTSVAKGQVLGTVGSTGNATGNVLHYEVLVNGVQKNPVNYL
ncbi:MAG: peptidoglycan DD-metalloendopeptidase family protein [Eubacteriales bacterium]|nr:peptidoglycan DD-metalloendopeptidase family protein [Eubacteriales bacterium]